MSLAPAESLSIAATFYLTSFFSHGVIATHFLAERAQGKTATTVILKNRKQSQLVLWYILQLNQEVI
jgi:hypothetical protein